MTFPGNWTPADDAALRDAMRRGDSHQAIADRLGRTKGAVAGRADRLGVARKKRDLENEGPGWLARGMRAMPALPPVRFCQWPIGDPRDEDFRFCGAPAVEGRPYCDRHCARAYTRYEAALAEEDEGEDEDMLPENEDEGDAA